MTSLLWRHLYLERSQSVQYFVQQFSFLQLASVEQHCELNEKSEQVQQANMCKCQTLMFHCSTYRPNSFKHLSHHTPVWTHEGIDRCDRCISRRNNTATRFFLINNTFSKMNKLLHQTCIDGLVTYLSPTGCISDWMAFVLSPFAHSKRITEGCSLWDDFNGTGSRLRWSILT